MPVNMANEDIIYGSTPLETHLANRHPRLHVFEEDVLVLRSRLDLPPWKRWIETVRANAESSLLDQAFLFTLTREPRWRTMALRGIRTLLAKPADSFGADYRLACAYDWLYHDLSTALRTQIRNSLEHRLRPQYEALAKHELYESGTVGWNIAAENLCNLAAAGFALYGETPNMAPWVRFITEKARVVTQALGSDGVSAEGICYGGFFNESYVRILDMLDRLMRVNLFEDNAYLQQITAFYRFSTLPSRHLTARESVLCFGDGATHHWYGPSSHLYRIAAGCRHSAAQAFASEMDAADVSRPHAAVFNLIWYDPSVPMPRTGKRPPRFHHFTDKDIVAMRSDWRGDETVVLFKCGPHGGHKALRDYPQCIAGGHMAPDAGSLLLYGHGARLISDGGYARKHTAYRNTVLVNGIGQTGACEGPESSDWFECRDLRREQRGPCILRAETRKNVDYIIGNVAPAYPDKARVTRFLRHLIYLRPGTCVLVDELETETASTFELWFHANTLPHQTPQHPFVPSGEPSWTTSSGKGACRITSLTPENARGIPGTQPIEGIGAHVHREVDVLRLKNTRPRRSVVFVTVLDVLSRNALPPAMPSIRNLRNGRLALTMQIRGSLQTLVLNPGRKDPAEPILEAEGRTGGGKTGRGMPF